MKKFSFAVAFFVLISFVITSFRPLTNTQSNSSSSVSEFQAPTKWALDKAHSNVKFTVTHMVVSEVDGSFKNFDATVEHSNPDFSDAKISFTVDVSSIDTDNENRDKHLRSDDFFNAEKFPQMKFESTSFTMLGDKKYRLNGNLTIRDVTKPVTFDVTYGGSVNTQRGAKAGFKAKTTVNRFDYNLKWDRATEAGGLVVAKDVDIVINAQFNQVKPQ